MASNKLWIAGASNRLSTPAQRISVLQSSKSPGTGPVLACCRAVLPHTARAARVFRSQILMSWLLFSC